MIMTKKVATVPNSLKELGGTEAVIRPI